MNKSDSEAKGTRGRPAQHTDPVSRMLAQRKMSQYYKRREYAEDPTRFVVDQIESMKKRILGKQGKEWDPQVCDDLLAFLDDVLTDLNNPEEVIEEEEGDEEEEDE